MNPTFSHYIILFCHIVRVSEPCGLDTPRQHCCCSFDFMFRVVVWKINFHAGYSDFLLMCSVCLTPNIAFSITVKNLNFVPFRPQNLLTLCFSVPRLLAITSSDVYSFFFEQWICLTDVKLQLLKQQLFSEYRLITHHGAIDHRDWPSCSVW